jgi:membrane protein
MRIGAWSLDIFTIARKTVTAWMAHNASSSGAAIAFYTLFAIAPIVVIAVGIASTILGPEVANAHILDQIRALIGDTGASAVQDLLAGLYHQRRSGVMEAVSIITLVIGATSVFAELQNALSVIWATPERTGVAGIWQFVRTRFLSLGMILGVGFLLLVSLIASAALALFGSWLGSFIAEWQTVLSALNQVVGFAMTTLLFALIYKYVPHEKIAWGDVWIGSLVTATLFTIGKLIIGAYLGRNTLTSAYGAAGSFVVLLLWVYYSSQIFLLGAEFTCVFAYRRGSRVTPSGARVMQPPEVARSGLAPARAGAGSQGPLTTQGPDISLRP